MVNLIGIGHVGIGSDFYGGTNPPGLGDASAFPNLFAELITRGWSDDAMAKLAGGRRGFLQKCQGSLVGTLGFPGRSGWALLGRELGRRLALLAWPVGEALFPFFI
jgi:hypothetical protein